MIKTQMKTARKEMVAEQGDRREKNARASGREARAVPQRWGSIGCDNLGVLFVPDDCKL